MLHSRMFAPHLRCVISALLLLYVRASAEAPGNRKCDFEDGWCSWKNEKSSNGDLAWLLGSRSLEAALLRPSQDHTLGSAKGSYLLLSNFERNTGDRADLIGEALPSGSGITQCVEFWYDISADKETSLTLLATNLAGKALKEDHLWTQNGAGKGGTWKKARVAAPRGSRLVFRGTVGPASKPGYIALDDISVIENDRCKTLPKGADQEPVASLLSCDFNGGDLCRWFSEVQNGATKWAFGPPEGSTLGPVLMPKNGEGGMIYVNGSILLTNNNNVDLRSYIVGPQQEAGCFSFWYHMFAGRDTQLDLYQRKAEESDKALTQFRVLFRHSDRTMADRWYNARLTVLLDAKINQFAFFSTLAHNTANAAVIALGPLDYTPGACDVFTDAKGYCDFEFDQCGWISTDGWKRDERPSELDDLHHHIRSGPVNSVYVLKAAELSGKKITTVTSPEWAGQTEPQCLEFWYTRTGPAGAELQAELLVSNKSQVIWKRPPTLEWMLARVPIVHKKTFQVVFRATFPAPAWRTLSLDNVALRPEPCIHPANCDFVEGLCGYVNSFRRDFRWLIGHGRLENPELQPSVPIPQGVFSSFAYLDLSSNAFMYSRQEKTVGLLSPFFDIGDDQTAIGFQYFRNGPDIAKANLSVSCYSDGKPNSIEMQYSAELHEVTEWTELNVPLKQGLNCQLAVWVIKGDGTNGAIAIHSVKVQQKDSTPKSNKDTATHCTFDKGTMCGWSTDGGLMTWTLNDPAKKVPGYPRFDHTQRAYKGRFIFVENKNTSYKSAVLKSPVLDVQSTDGACLSLWHIAQHTFNGSITVYYGDQHLLTTITRTSHRWQHALAEFKVPTGSLQLQIEVSIGRGLIALDDLHIAAGRCPQTDICSWEMDSPCVVNQDPGNVTPWTRCEGKNVGIPDHTHDSLEGYYLYVNTTALNSHHPMSRAFLPRRDPTEATCVTFWWRAHGAASQLNVYRFTKETALRDPLVSLRTHSGGDWWNVRTINVTSGTQWNLVFEVVAPAGEKHQSGVMIDDVEFTDGQCPPYNLCTFENECLPWKLPTKGDWETRFEVQRAESFKKLSKDHSTATSDGFYLLYRSTGVKGNRTSLTLREPSRYVCVSLWYFLPSLTDGVSLLLQSESVPAGKEVWKEKQFHLPLKTGGAPIEAISGSNREGFVAIDDVLISETECPGTSNLSTPDFTCNDGKKVPVDRVCDFVPDCKDKADEKKCGHCDFRKDACGWNLDDVRNQGSASWQLVPIALVPRSPPIGIKGERDGNYLLFYANGTGSSKSSHAMIESPKIRNTNKLCTLKFWFNYAGNGDNINVDLHMTVGGYAVPVWTLRSFEGMPKEGVWNEADVEVGRYATEVSFHFSSKQSTQGRAIFALGAIEYSGCALPTKRSKCTTSQFRCANGVCVERNNRCNYADDCGDNSDEEGCGDYRLGCSFDSSFCDWTPLPPLHIYDSPWELSRPSSSLLTGPTRDHTTGTPNGQFIILRPTFFGKNTATIVGPTLDHTKPCTITFFYTAQGTSLPELSVSVRTSKDEPWKRVWVLVMPSKFAHFVPAHVNLMQPKPFQVAFIGEYRNTGNAGYIAIDDVTFSATCTPYQGVFPGAPTPSQPPSPPPQTLSPMPPSPPPRVSPMPPTPPPFACGDNEFQCGNSEQCISLTIVCDFKDDCSNSADEANCGACEFTRDLCGLENEDANARFGWTWKAAQDAIHNDFPVTDSRHNEHGSYAAYSLLNSDVPVGSGRNSMITPRLGPIAHSCVVSFYVSTGNVTSFLIFGVLPPLVDDPSSLDAVILANVYASKSEDKWTYVTAKTGNWPAGTRFFYLAEAVGVSVDRAQYINCHPDSQIDGSMANQQVSCNFSRPQDCGWFPERLAADIDWVIQADGAALSSHTWQPSKSASGTGAYMYAQNMLPGVKKAHLVSVRMSPTPDVGRCFTFWYNMWHPNSGELNLLQRVDNISTSLLWTRSGPQGMAWQQGQVQLHCDEPQQLVFEAVLKPYIPGVIAIDEFTLKDGLCDPGDVCTFESGSCGWQLHNWEITKGSSVMLPAADHSTWAPPGAFALVMPPSGRMVSPQGWYDATQHRCLRFWFFAAGSAAETLNITRVVDQVQEQSLWFHSAVYTPAKSWLSAAVNLTVSQGNIITVFEGMTSGNPGTAVAVDDISLGNEACPKPGSCSFEEDTCNWHNNKGLNHAQWYRHRGRTIFSLGGLEKDHTKGTIDGYYLLLDSQDQSDISIGSFQSEALSLGPVVCFQLYYHMKNGTSASINVAFNDASGVPTGQQTTVYATGPAEWTLLSVEGDNLPRVYSVVITATAGKFAGDVAIDDIDMRPGKCKGAPDSTSTSQSTTTTTVTEEPSTMRNTEASVTATKTAVPEEPSTISTSEATVTATMTAVPEEPSTISTSEATVTATMTSVPEHPSTIRTSEASVTEQSTLVTEEDTTLVVTATEPPSAAPSVTPVECSHGQFDCGDDTTCIPSFLWCDGIRDCPNGLDEDCSTMNVCKENEFYCPSRSPRDCLPSSVLCDGTDDCLGGADESLCEVCPDSFCLNDGTCSWTLQHRSPMCNCSEGHKGSRCQLLATSVPAEEDRLRVARSSGSIVASVLVVLAVVAVGVATSVVIIRRRRAAQNPRLLYNSASYDVTTEETEFRD